MSNETAPVVVADTSAGHTVLVGPAELDARDGSLERLLDAIEQAAARLGLAWTTPAR